MIAEDCPWSLQNTPKDGLLEVLMDRLTERGNRHWIVLYMVYGGAMVGLVCLLFLLRAGRIEWLTYLGWALFAISAVLGWLPILEFRRHGRVAKRRSYIHTTALATSGLYSIVRHPQYLASDFLAVAVVCISQHWTVYLTSVIAIAANHVCMVKADRDLVEKFGEPYREYLRRVPRWNFLVGLWRWWRRRTR